MAKENYVKYYLNYPVETSIGVSPYCVRLLDWEEYIKIAGKYLIICEDLIRRRFKLVKNGNSLIMSYWLL